MERNHNIGFVCSSSSWGGLEMNVLRLARWLADRGWPVTLYGSKGSPLQQQSLSRGLMFRPFGRTGTYGGLVSGLRLGRLLDQDHIRLLTIHSSRDLPVSIMGTMTFARHAGLINVQHMQLGTDKKDFIHSWEYNRLAAWVTPLEILAESVQQRTHISPERLRVIPFGIETARFTDRLPPREAARTRLQLPLSEPIAGVIGRFDPKKGQDTLIRACYRVRKAGRSLHLLLVGDETLNEEHRFVEYLKLLVHQLELEDCVHFHAHIDDVEYAYAALDYFALTSHSETYGMVTIEAMASGVPVIATDSGGTPGIVQDSVNGLLVPSQNDEALAVGLIRLMADSTLTSRLISRARQDVLRKYSHQHQCDSYESLFADLLNGPPR